MLLKLLYRVTHFHQEALRFTILAKNTTRRYPFWHSGKTSREKGRENSKSKGNCDFVVYKFVVYRVLAVFWRTCLELIELSSSNNSLPDLKEEQFRMASLV